MILLIGLAVGVDYSLFYLRREREERRAGHSNEAALEIAAATSGRAVLVSGLTVMIAMAGMFLTGNATFMSFAIGHDPRRRGRDARLADGAAGGAVEARRPGREGPRAARSAACARGDGESRVWSAILDRVLRRPLVSAVAGRLGCWSRWRSRRST